MHRSAQYVYFKFIFLHQTIYTTIQWELTDFKVALKYVIQLAACIFARTKSLQIKLDLTWLDLSHDYYVNILIGLGGCTKYNFVSRQSQVHVCVNGQHAGTPCTLISLDLNPFHYPSVSTLFSTFLQELPTPVTPRLWFNFKENHCRISSVWLISKFQPTWLKLLQTQTVNSSWQARFYFFYGLSSLIFFLCSVRVESDRSEVQI